MDFILISIAALAGLGVVAALVSIFTKGGTDEAVVKAHDCASCSSVATGECKIGCLIEEKRHQENNKNRVT